MIKTHENLCAPSFFCSPGECRNLVAITGLIKRVRTLANTASQAPTLGALENIGWTSLSIGIAAVLLPAIGLKALSKAVFPKAFKPAPAEERHYLIQ